MPKPFDAATKHLIESQPGDWLEYVGLERVDVDVVDADLSTVTADADKVLRVRHEAPWLVHLELQSGYESDLGERTLQYSVLLSRRHGLSVQSIVVLLRPDADGPRMTGSVQRFRPDGKRYLDFEYEIVRAWQKSVEDVLAGGLGVLPMAPLANVTLEVLPGVIRRMEERIRQEASPGEAGLLWTATYVLMGLRYSRAIAAVLLQGVREMKESVTYQAIVEEGRIAGEQAILLRQGNARFGPPTPEARAKLEGITSIERLESLAVRILKVESWDELLAE